MERYAHLFNTQPNVNFNRRQEVVERETNSIPGASFRNNKHLEMSNATLGNTSNLVDKELRNVELMRDFKNKALFTPSMDIQLHSSINTFNPI